MSKKEQSNSECFAFAIKTFLRDKQLYALVESIKENFPYSKIYIADDGKMTKRKNKFYQQLEKEGHKVLKLDFDVGLSAGRNALLDVIEEPFYINCDDDFLIKPESLMNISRIVRLLIAKPNILLAGGITVENTGEVRAYAYNFKTKDGVLYQRPAEGQVKVFENIRYRKADMVCNFFIGRVPAMRKIRWDEQFKIGYEHADFVMRVKDTSWDIVFTPDISVWHSRIRASKEYEEFRIKPSRIKLQAFYDKHGLKKAIYPSGNEWHVPEPIERNKEK